MSTNPKPDLLFDEPTHTYRVDGVVIPSVTQILEAVGIIDYSHIPPADREWALERGRMVHLYTQYDDEGTLDDSAVDPRIRPYLEAWRAFRRDTGLILDKINGVEKRVYSRSHGYAGTLDRIGILARGIKTVLVDIKTNKAEPWVKLQLAAYAGAVGPPPLQITRVCVELRDDETYRVLTFSGANFNADFADFLGALRTMRWLQKMKRIPNERTNAA